MAYLYERNRRFFAQIAGGSEGLGIRELVKLGATDVEAAYRGVYFRATNEALYRIAYSARLLSRILAPLVSFDCHNEEGLYQFAHTRIRWDDFLTPDHTFLIFSNVGNSRINHSQYAALKLKDAIVDQFRDQYGARPSIDKEAPDVSFNLHIDRNKAIISLDVSGGSLHRRGYRRVAGPAPMQETVAAAILELAEWKGDMPLYDPMCGSGTLLAEALMVAGKVPAGWPRPHWCIPHLPDYDKRLWGTVRKHAEAAMQPVRQGLIRGSDVDQKVLRAARENLNRLPEASKVEMRCLDFRDLPNLDGHTIVVNPPYGIRMGDTHETAALYKAFGDFLKQYCKGSTAYIYCGNRELISAIGLKPAFKKPLVNGPLDGRLVKIELY
ncbi:MAG TPA: THUMP domain-containing protein [Rhodothermales bacterium]|nr:RNA methyltransferase [Bacteroidota bacterium]HRK72659.1 THUMP domain-containing protein [Rhodothermales bacterium]HRR08401.1 THUMP domain-containing protein [Rhodothermales bacterium]